MAFQTPITIRQAIGRIQTNQYVLPAIQREFVWPTRRIEWLFDSLMRDYPIGSFLFWKVQSESIERYKFYDFMLKYHEKDNRHCGETGLLTRDTVTAVLDGQQRLTALNIALQGTYAYKLPRLWWSNPDAFPIRQLYLNLFQDAQRNEQGMRYDFRFLTKEEVAIQDDSRCWYPVGNVLKEDNTVALFKYLTKRLDHMRPAELDEPLAILDRLREAVHVKPVIAFYEETSQDIDRVLDVFIRTNSGGMMLSRSDMLMSIATAHWQGDARSAINGALQRINAPHVGGFGFSRDFLLKAGLMLAGIRSVAFMVTNFTIKNIELLNDEWDQITDSVYAAARLVRDFGFSQSTLTSHSAVLPVAHYLHLRGGHAESKKDAKKIREWLTRSLLKRGIWGSGLDTLLVRLRAVIDEHGGDGFPAAKIEEEMSRRGKSLAFAPEELQDLVESKDRVFALLSTLYPFVDTHYNQFHIDHIFPKSRFTWGRLKEAGVPEDDIPQFQDRADRLPNLQLLAGRPNQEKSATLPREWLDGLGAEKAAEHRRLHDLGEVPAAIADFNEFYETRRDRLLGRLEIRLGTKMGVADDGRG